MKKPSIPEAFNGWGKRTALAALLAVGAGTAYWVARNQSGKGDALDQAAERKEGDESKLPSKAVESTSHEEKMDPSGAFRLMKLLEEVKSEIEKQSEEGILPRGPYDYEKISSWNPDDFTDVHQMKEAEEHLNRVKQRLEGARKKEERIAGQLERGQIRQEEVESLRRLSYFPMNRLEQNEVDYWRQMGFVTDEDAALLVAKEGHDLFHEFENLRDEMVQAVAKMDNQRIEELKKKKEKLILELHHDPIRRMKSLLKKGGYL